MAKIIKNIEEFKPAVAPYSILRIVLLGAVLGIIYWCLYMIIAKLNISVNLSGNIVIIIVAIIGILLMVRMRMAQPLLISVASAFALWGLSNWVNGLSIFENIIYDIFLYGLAYTLFSWIARYKRPSLAIIFIILIIIVLRVMLTL